MLVVVIHPSRDLLSHHYGVQHSKVKLAVVVQRMVTRMSLG